MIIKYLSKHTSIFALKSKKAEEVVEALWTWITRFGPPDTIISDQGKEFVNSTVTALLEKTGVEKRVTSPNNPSADGQVERMNQTVISVLRKHAETDQREWDQWISYVEYAYNTRRNPTTGFSPFEVVYGAQANDFID